MRGSLPSHHPTSNTIETLERRTLFTGGGDPDLDFVLRWNAIALQAVADDFTPSEVPSPDQPGSTKTARALAIVHAAIFDAVNSIDGSYEPFTIYVNDSEDASMGAAVSQAAHDALVALYPQQADDFHAALRSARNKIPDGPAERQGIALGKRVAKACLFDRESDGSEVNLDYDEPIEPGIFQTFPGEPDALGPGWGNVTPFTMSDVAHFRAPPPPDMTSDAYRKAYNEVKRVGGDGVTTPTQRTAEQTRIGIYWGYDGTPGLGTPPRLYNQIARVIARQQCNTQVENARLFALINFAMADAGIASWDTKYMYDLWRPIRGIRQLDANGNPLDDGNPGTVADPDWTPLGAQYTNAPPGSSNFTPPFPAYTSGHATFGGALFQTLKRFYGTDNITFTFVSDELNGRNAGPDGVIRPKHARTFHSFSQAAEENGQSRIYLGIHWAFDKTAGIAQGQKVANYAFDNYLRPVCGDDAHRADLITLAKASRADITLTPPETFVTDAIAAELEKAGDEPNEMLAMV